jgi:hypothetical protein
MNATTATPVATATPPAAIPVAGSAGTSANPGAAPGVEQLPALVGPQRDAATVQLDAFARRGGPDVAVNTDHGLVRVHAVFQMDPATKEMSVSVVDEAGRLIRMIPPDSVAQMIAAMAAYRSR